MAILVGPHSPEAPITQEKDAVGFTKGHLLDCEHILNEELWLEPLKMDVLREMAVAEY